MMVLNTAEYEVYNGKVEVISFVVQVASQLVIILNSQVNIKV